MSKNLMPVYFNQKFKMNKRKLKMKKNAMDPVNFEEERKNDPKYKTELCKSFMETNFCVYGNKCRFAHGFKELVKKNQINNYKQKTCNSFYNKGYCPYGNRCNFKHDERKLEQIRVPYYFSHLISLHFPQLKTCKRLNVFQEISYEKFKSDERIIKQIEAKYKEQKMKEEIENKNKKEELSNSFCSEKSSQASSITDSSNKEIEIELEIEKEEIDYNEVSDFFLKDINYELDFFPNEK